MTISRTLVHRGTRTATTRLTLVQDGRLRAEAVAVQVRRDHLTATVRTVGTPATTPPAGYAGRPHVQGDLAFAHNLEIRTPAFAGVEAGISAWLRLAGPPADLGLRTGPAVACVMLDALLPVLFAGESPPVFVPTIEFAYAFTPAATDIGESWCVGENRLDWLEGEFCGEDATLTSAADGRLVARQRQLRSIRRSI
jgi:hypothetical protein